MAADSLSESTILYPAFCSIQDDWEYPFIGDSSSKSPPINNDDDLSEFWISVIKHNADEQKRLHIDATVNIDIPQNDQQIGCTLTPQIDDDVKHENLNWNITLLPLPPDPKSKSKAKSQSLSKSQSESPTNSKQSNSINSSNDFNHRYYAQITYDLWRCNLIPSYHSITDSKPHYPSKRTPIHCLDVAKSSYFKRWYIASGLENGTINIHDVETSKLKMNCSGHNGRVTTCKFFPFGDLILSGDTRGVLNIYAVADPKGKPAVSFHVEF